MFVNRNLILWRAPRPADPVGRLGSGCMSTLPSLLSLTIDAAVLNIHHLTNLNAIPDAIVLELFQKTLAAGKLTESVLKVFMATGNEQVLGVVKALDIRPVLKPILPTRCHENI
eukprot:c21580_g1_i2 orf=278-619(-)